MHSTRLLPLIFAALITIGGSILPDAEASSHATRWKTYTDSVAAATASTTVAATEWGKWPAREAAFVGKMRTHNSSSRHEVKRAEATWLRNMKRLLDRAIQDHVKAIRALDAYTYFAGTNAGAKAARASLKEALHNLRLHSNEIPNVIVRVGRMR